MNALALKVIYAIWLREFKTFSREKFRVIGMIGQPLLYLAILGKGISSGMRLNSTGSIDYVKYMYPGVIGMSLLFTSIFSALSIIWDREFGFLKEVLVAPVPRWAVSIGKTLGGATVAMVQAIIMVVMAPLVGISLSVLLVVKLLMLAFLMSVAITSLGIVIASRMESMQSFQMVMNFMVMPLYFLSGAMFPMTTAPPVMKAFMMADPLTYGVDAIRHVVFSDTMVQIGNTTRPLVDVAREAGLIRFSMGWDIALMSAAAVILAALGAWSFSKTQTA